MRYFVFSDVHGYYSLLKNELDKKGFDVNNNNHMLISIGDNFDRGPENYQMYKFLLEMKKLKKIILVKGNHEDLFLKMLYRRKATYIDMTNGTYGTLIEFTKQYTKNDPEDQFYIYPDDVYLRFKEEGIIDFFYDMLDYYETDNYIFTHGFIPIDKDSYKYKYDWRLSTPDDFASSRWLNGIEMSMRYNIGEKSKKIVVGHFHTSYGNVRKLYPNKTYEEYYKLEFKDLNNFDIYEDDNIYAIDGCTHFSKRINILVVDD